MITIDALHLVIKRKMHKSLVKGHDIHIGFLKKKDKHVVLDRTTAFKCNKTATLPSDETNWHLMVAILINNDKNKIIPTQILVLCSEQIKAWRTGKGGTSAEFKY